MIKRIYFYLEEQWYKECLPEAAEAVRAYREYGFDALRNLFDFKWIPRYKTPDDGMATGKEPDFECDLWQFTSNQRISGISGRVDMNIVTGKGKSREWFTGRAA